MIVKNFRNYSFAIWYIVIFFILLLCNICLIPIKENAKSAEILLGKNNMIISTSWDDSISQYQVYHYKETLITDVYYDNYDVCDEMSGPIDSLTDAKSKPYNGFTALPFEQKRIEGDGSTIVKIYYKRNSYKLNFKSADTVLCSYDVKYDEDISAITYANDPPQREGYTFSNWSPKPNGMPEYDVDITAVWELNTPVIVKCSNVTKTYGTAVELSCNVSNCLDSITTYEWYKGEQKVGQGKTLLCLNVADSGTYSLKVKVYDGEQTKQAESGDISVIIEKAIYDMKNITFKNKEVFYDGNAHSIQISGSLINGVTVTYSNNLGTEIGEYIATAHFDAGENYEQIEDMRATLKIVAAPNQDEDKTEEEKPNIPNGISISEQELLGEILNLSISNVCTVCLEKETLTKIRIKAHSKSVTITVNPIDNALSIEKFHLSSGSKIYSLSLFIGSEFVEFEGSAFLCIPYMLKENEKAEDIRVWSIENDKLTEIDNVNYQNGYVSFKAASFSYFAVDTLAENKSGVKSYTLFIIGVISIVSIVFISLMFIRNAKKKKK